MALTGILGKKLGMTQLFLDDGRMVPVTAVQAGPCTVTQVKSSQSDGYEAVQLGFEQGQKLNKPERGHLKPAGADFRYLRELRVKSAELQVGQKVDASIFKAGDVVDVTGTSRGKGFAGVMKRHGFKGGPRTHGQSTKPRHPGSIGNNTFPSRIIKGRRMAGHMGVDRVTEKNLEVVRVDTERNLLFVSGAVPGADNGLLLIRQAKSVINQAKPKQGQVTRVATKAPAKAKAAPAKAAPAKK